MCSERHRAQIDAPPVPETPPPQTSACASQEISWLRLQSVLLRSAVRVAEQLALGINVVLHCSDGWDRTPQVSCLAQMLLDPHYRTLEGLAL